MTESLLGKLMNQCRQVLFPRLVDFRQCASSSCCCTFLMFCEILIQPLSWCFLFLLLMLLSVSPPIAFPANKKEFLLELAMDVWYEKRCLYLLTVCTRHCFLFLDSSFLCFRRSTLSMLSKLSSSITLVVSVPSNKYSNFYYFQ